MRINGAEIGAASAAIKIDGTTYPQDIKSIKWDQSVERGKNYGLGSSLPRRRRVRGKYAASMSFSMFEGASDAEGMRALRKSLGDGWSEKEFEVVLTYDETESGGTVHEVVFEDVMIAKESNSTEVGSTDALMCDVETDVRRIKRDGLYMVTR